MPHFFDEASLRHLPAGNILVFGSNQAGRHTKGAAALALERFGAVLGRGSGFQGRSYAVMVRDRKREVLPLESIAESVHGFLLFARCNPQMHFWVTNLGAGMDQYAPEQFVQMLKDSPSNCSFASVYQPGFQLYSITQTQ